MFDHHDFVTHWMKTFLHPGDFAVDMTAGNGWDTLALAEIVGKEGRVLSVDVQPAAVERTRARLEEAEAEAIVDVLCLDHSRIPWDEFPAPSFVIYNLGYLPGDFHRASMTHPIHTVHSLRSALCHLKPDGAVCVTVYRSHDADTEHGVLFAGLSAMEDVHIHMFRSMNDRAPIVYGLQPKPERRPS